MREYNTLVACGKQPLTPKDSFDESHHKRQTHLWGVVNSLNPVQACLNSQPLTRIYFDDDGVEALYQGTFWEEDILRLY